MRRFIAACILCCTLTPPASAELTMAGRGQTLRFDSANFPEKMKASYETLRTRCAKCHTQERIVISFMSSRMPVTGQEFDLNSVKTLAFRMYRKSMTRSDAIIHKDEMKNIHAVLRYMMEESSR